MSPKELNNNRNVKAMVMAAGAGTRLRPITNDVPKPMVPIANKPVLEYTIENLKRHGITDIIMNLHSHPNQIRTYFGDGARWGVKLHYSDEPKLLGTAGGVKNVEWFLNSGTFFVLSGDGLTDANLSDILAFHWKHRAVATMGLKEVDTRFDYGVTMTDKKGKIDRFVEKPLWSEVFSNQVNTGIYVFEPEIFNVIPARTVYDFGHQVWPGLLKSKKHIYGFPIKNYWCDVGNLNEYRRAQRNVLDGEISLNFSGKMQKKGIWIDEGTSIHAKSSLSAPCLIGRDCRIDKNVHVGPYTTIGNGVHIGEGSHIQNCTLWDNVRIGKGIRLENCILTQRTSIQEAASTYEGAVIHLTHS